MKDTSILTKQGINLEQSLEILGDIEFYNEALQDFQNEAQTKVEKLKQYLEENDMENYAIQIHSLKSEAKYLGFTHLAELSLNQEMESKQNNKNYIVEHFDELIQELNTILKIISEYLK